jgi:hypothetical protein
MSLNQKFSTESWATMHPRLKVEGHVTHARLRETHTKLILSTASSTPGIPNAYVVLGATAAAYVTDMVGFTAEQNTSQARLGVLGEILGCKVLSDAGFPSEQQFLAPAECWITLAPWQ